METGTRPELWHFAAGIETKCGVLWVEQPRNTVATLQQWFTLLMAEARGEARLCFRWLHVVAKETKADRRAYLKVTVL